MAREWRLLITEPCGGATNMAIDEALLRGRIAAAAPPTVRFYAWAPPTVSLGYAQPVDPGIDWARCRTWGIGVVRRPTGGSAILHEGAEREVTYSVVAQAGDFAGADDVLETYRMIGAGLAAGLERLGVRGEVVPLARAQRRGAAPPFCFARAGAYEVAVDGRKLIGSAQRRQGGAFLQHGSVLVAMDPERLRAVFPSGPDPIEGLTTLEQALGRTPGFQAVTAALAEGLARELGVALRPGGLDPIEAALAERLVVEKYDTVTWTQAGVLPVPAAAARGDGGR